jgi:hypothetical protein
MADRAIQLQALSSLDVHMNENRSLDEGGELITRVSRENCVLGSLSLGGNREDIYFKREFIKRSNILSPSNQICNKTSETGTLLDSLKLVVIKFRAKLRQLHEYKVETSK